jgi:hypothetical protein
MIKNNLLQNPSPARLPFLFLRYFLNLIGIFVCSFLCIYIHLIIIKLQLIILMHLTVLIPTMLIFEGCLENNSMSKFVFSMGVGNFRLGDIFVQFDLFFYPLNFSRTAVHRDN